MIIDKCLSDKLNGEYTFVSFEYSIKIVSDVYYQPGLLKIVTILGKNENSRKNDKIIII